VDRREADERLSTLIGKVDVIIMRLDSFISRFEEKEQEDKMRQLVREASRGRTKTDTKAQ